MIEADDENRNPSAVHRNSGALQLRKPLHDSFDDQQAASRGSVLGLPPVLYGQAEDRGHGRPGGEVPPTPRPADQGSGLIAAPSPAQEAASAAFFVPV